MRIQQLLEHHGVIRNPFAEEDAQTDPVFKEHCIASIYHPSWDKVYGDPADPSTAVVFGEKGAGKTALRLQIARHLRQYNAENPQRKVFVVHYDDLNPLLDRFRHRLSRRKQRPDLALNEWRLWDHMDSILAIAVTGLVDRWLGVKQPSSAVDGDFTGINLRSLDRPQARDILLLAACYDQSTRGTFEGRWEQLRRALRFSTWRAKLAQVGGIAAVGLVIAYLVMVSYRGLDWPAPWWVWLLVMIAALIPWAWRWLSAALVARRIVRHVRIGVRDAKSLRRTLQRFTRGELASQPLPTSDSTDTRYELLLKLQGLLRHFDHPGIVVLFDRIDEPHLINGSAELMKMLVWPILDNKFLKQDGIGIKLMLPLELTRFIEREGSTFYQRARLDKQNMVPSFVWTGEALYDVANARLRACARAGEVPKLSDFFESQVDQRKLLDSLRALRTPRHLFKFLYRLLINHCNSHTDDAPVWKIPLSAFDSTLAVYLREQDAFDRGVGPG
ncbi:MAG: hypothetical protein ACKOU6_02470 [Planctomycetota bacterium]